jgi:transposase-like protein
MAETKKDALVAFDAFVETWGVKYDKAVQCLTKDRDALLAFYDFPAEHWKDLRTTDEMDKRFSGSSPIFFSARATSWRRAEPRLEALPAGRLSQALPA